MKLFEATVLYVEDDLFTRALVSKILKIHAGRVYVAGDGQEAWERYQSIFPDILITDLRMPKMTGEELIYHVRNDCSHIPIVVVSGFKDDCPNLIGANAILDKPINTELLISTVKKEIKLFDGVHGLLYKSKRIE